MLLMGTRYAGADNDSYFDDLFLRIWQDQTCLGLLGDINGDSTLNIQDVILMINMIFNGDYTFLADMNEDNSINVQDVILLVNLILNP